MTFKASTLRPGLLVNLKTSVTGNVSYTQVVLEDEKEVDGGLFKRWETARTVADRKEHDEAIVLRNKCRHLIISVCASSAFGYLCAEVNSGKLAAAVAEAREIADEFNSRARLSRINVYVIAGRIAADDVEAVRAINYEISDLLGTIERGLQKLDVKAVRDAAAKAKSLGQMLSSDAQSRVNVAVVAAREAAKKIVAAAETGTVEIDRVALQAIAQSRTAFLDFDAEQVLQAPVAQARAIDLPVVGQAEVVQDTVIPSRPAPAVAPSIEL